MRSSCVIISYAELRGYTEKEMFSLVEDKIMKNTRLALDRMKNRDVRAAAEFIARERVEDAMRKAGALIFLSATQMIHL